MSRPVMRFREGIGSRRVTVSDAWGIPHGHIEKGGDGQWRYLTRNFSSASIMTSEMLDIISAKLKELNSASGI